MRGRLKPRGRRRVATWSQSDVTAVTWDFDSNDWRLGIHKS